MSKMNLYELSGNPNYSKIFLYRFLSFMYVCFPIDEILGKILKIHKHRVQVYKDKTAHFWFHFDKINKRDFYHQFQNSLYLRLSQ